MARDYICLYHSYLDAIQALGDAERGRLFTAMLEYSMTGEAPQLNGNERFIFPMMKAQIDRDRSRYESICQKNSDNGRKRSYATDNDRKRSYADGSKGKGEEEGKGKDKGDLLPPVVPPPGEPKKRFVPPSVDEVRAYCQERGNGIDPQGFVDFYAARGWVVGKTPMKDWKAAVRTWESRDSARKPHGKPTAQDMSDDTWRYV